MLKDAMVFTSVATKDLAGARTWFEEKLGLTPDQESVAGLIYTCAGGTGFLLYETQFAGTAKNTVAGWRVGDIDAEMKDLRSRGVTFEDFDFPGLKTVDGVASLPEGRGAWFVDPDGNTYALTEM